MNNFLDQIATLSGEEQRRLLAQLLLEKEQPDERFPLSFSQQRIWIVNRINPNSASYNLHLCVALEGKFEISTLRRTVSEIVRRHEILRTTFQDSDGEPYQLIRQAEEIEIVEYDLTAFSADLQSSRFEHLCDTQLAEPFDLRRFPLLRCDLVKLSKDYHYFLVTLHHIIFDGWSVNILTKEFVEIFSAYQNGAELLLPPPEIQYADYCVWERENFKDNNFDSQFEFLRENLGGELEPLNLPMDYPRPAIQNLRGEMIQKFVGKTESEELRKLAKSLDCSLFMILLGGFGILLNRYTQQNQIRIGTPSSGRNQIETEDIIGCFINTLVIPLEVERRQTIREYLQDVRRRAVKSYECRELPFEKVVERLQIGNDQISLLMQVMFQFLEYGAASERQKSDSIRVGDVLVKPVNLKPSTVNFDIAVSVEESENDELAISMHYSSEIFKQATIEKFLDHYCRVLEQIITALNRQISEISFLNEAEEKRILEDWQGQKVDYSKILTLPQLFEKQVSKTPEAIAVQFENDCLTFAELDKRSNRIANFLIENGTKAEEIVALISERSLGLVVSLLGILKAGGAFLPIDADTPAARVEGIMKDSGANFLLVSESEAGHYGHIENLEVFSYAETENERFASQLHARREISPSNLAYVIYTSGSTGKPKGVMNTHEAIYNRLIWMQKEFRLNERDCVLQKTSIGFDVSVWELLLPLITGAKMLLARPGEQMNSQYLNDLIAREDVTLMHFVPPMLRAFLDSAESFRLDSLRAVICSGEALPKHVQDAFFQKLDASLYNLYGPTEAAIDVTSWICRKNDEQQTVPIGFPITNTQIYILDEELNLVPSGLSGELYIGGMNLARGYLSNPSLTADRFVPNPFDSQTGARLYKTGDVVRYLNDGSIEYIGRSDFQVKIRGNRVELGEIETALCAFADVKDAFVMVFNAENGEKHLVAFVIPSDDAPSATALKNYLREKLPVYMIPDFIEFLESFPVTSNGKTDRLQLQKLFIRKRLSEVPFVEPRTPLEKDIAKIWRELLGIEKIGVHDNFLDLGGHSLLHIQMASRLNVLLGIEVPLRMLFDAPTISDITETLTRLQIQQMQESGDFEASELLNEIENLSPEEINRLLAIEEDL